MRTPNDYERVVETVSKMDRGHGYNPETDRTFPPTESNRAMYQDAVAGGYITPRRRSWGHSVTAKGREVLRVLKRNALSGQNRDKLEFVIGSAVNTLFGVGVGSIRKLQKHFYIPCALHEDCLKDHELAVACALAEHEREERVRFGRAVKRSA